MVEIVFVPLIIVKVKDVFRLPKEIKRLIGRNWQMILELDKAIGILNANKTSSCMKKVSEKLNQV
jgi:hypothetical protein